MVENETAVKTNPGDAAAQAGVETTPKAPEVDLDFLEAVIETSIATTEKAVANAENWKKVGMSRKKKDESGQPAEITDEDINALAEVRANEIVTQHAIKAKAEAETKALKMLKEAREAKIALRNKAGVVTTVSTTSTSGASDPAKTDGHGWTEGQLAEMKSRGINIADKKFLTTAWNTYLKSKG